MNTSRFGTAFCESIDAADGVTTGISVADRAHTIRTAIAPGLISGWLGPKDTKPLLNGDFETVNLFQSKA